MTKRRGKGEALGLVLGMTLAAFASAPPLAQAGGGPLLSGYGGPGAGSQVILGGGLVGGGGSGSGGGGGAVSLAVPPSSASTGAPAAGGQNGHRGGNAAGKRAGHVGASRHGVSVPSPPAQGKSDAFLPVPKGGSDSGAPLGLTGADLLYVLLALGGLALTGGVTAQVVRRARRQGNV
jgi:hypothetical protein